MNIGTASTHIRKIRSAIADYMKSEGCSCCQDTDKHDKAKERLAKLLRVPKYKDGSGYDFGKYESDGGDGS